MGNPDPGDNKWPPGSQGWHGDPGWWRSPSAHGGGCWGGPGGEGRAEQHRQHCQALFSPIVLHFLPACALRWCPHGCPHGNRVTAAISHLPSSCQPGALLAHPPCVSCCHRHLSLLNNNSSHHLSLRTLVGVTVVPGAAWCSATMEDTLPCAPLP